MQNDFGSLVSKGFKKDGKGIYESCSKQSLVDDLETQESPTERLVDVLATLFMISDAKARRDSMGGMPSSGSRILFPATRPWSTLTATYVL